MHDVGRLFVVIYILFKFSLGYFQCKSRFLSLLYLSITVILDTLTFGNESKVSKMLHAVRLSDVRCNCGTCQSQSESHRRSARRLVVRGFLARRSFHPPHESSGAMLATMYSRGCQSYSISYRPYVKLEVLLGHRQLVVLLTYSPPPPPPQRACLVDARTLGAIRHLAILMMFTINRGSKVLKLRNMIRPDRLGTFLPVRRTHFPVFILLSIPHPISIHQKSDHDHAR